jgi:CheY-like chemotaxis protein
MTTLEVKGDWNITKGKLKQNERSARSIGSYSRHNEPRAIATCTATSRPTLHSAKRTTARGTVAHEQGAATQAAENGLVAGGFNTVNNERGLIMTMKTEKKRILVVDDRAHDTRLLKLFLERTNDYVVREENDARAALSAADEFEPDLILLDVMMPVVDGGELAARFRASAKLKAVPIVFLTALITKEEVNAGGGLARECPFWLSLWYCRNWPPVLSNTWADELNTMRGQKLKRRTANPMNRKQVDRRSNYGSGVLARI